MISLAGLDDVQSCTQVQAWSNKMGGEGGKLLADAIKAHANYDKIAQNMFNGESKVNMSNKQLDAGDAWIMGAALEKNDTVKEVHASRNLLRADGAKAFADVLKVNKTLTEIDLSNNEIGAELYSWGSVKSATPEGPAALAEVLKDNSSVTKVRVPSSSVQHSFIPSYHIAFAVTHCLYTG